MSATATRRPQVAPAPPLWRATPLGALEQPMTPSSLHFVRDHFAPPMLEVPWSMIVSGHARSLRLDFETLSRLPQRSFTVLLECAGHRRQEFDPAADGVPWGAGAVAQARWTGVSLRTVLTLAGVPPRAREVVLEGGDAGPVAGWTGEHRFARSLPLEKAMAGDVLLATAINGEPISPDRGGPVRAIVPGWYATDSVKWLDRVWFTAEPFDGVFQAYDYLFCTPDEPGPGGRMTEMAVHAIITTPEEGDRRLVAGERVVRGLAWGGAGGVAVVLVRVDLGPWIPAWLGQAPGRYAGVPWEVSLALPQGLHEIACRAVDGSGHAQPLQPVANVRGYANNAVHRVRVSVR